MDHPSAPWLDYLRSIDGPTLSNAVELLDIRPRHEGFTPLEIRQLFPEFGRMAGYAVTAQVETMTRMGDFRRDDFVELYRAVEASPKPAVIAFQEIGAAPDFAAHCGEVMATFFTRLGAIGLVSDCAVRDLTEVHALGFQYFARGVVVSHANFRIVRSGVPIQVRGMTVKPGDLLYGDQHGILSVPAGIEDRLGGAVDTIRRREKALMDFVRGNRFTLDGFRDFTVE